MPIDPTGAALLRAVCLDPDDVGARLVYADWLEQEAGDPERAEFIRLQCRIADLEATCNCGRCVKLRGGQHHNGPCAVEQEREELPDGRSRQALLRRRERELLDGVCGLGVEMLPAIDGLTRSNFVGRGGYGWFPREVSPAPGIEATFRRGFVEAVACPLTLWERHGPALVLAQPIREVRLVGAEPGTIGDGRHYWFDQMRSDPRFTLAAHHLPNWLFEALGGGAGEADGFSYRTYIIREAALDALSRACVAWARRKAGLDVECDRCRGSGRYEWWDKDDARMTWCPCPGCKGAGWVAAR